MALTREQIAIRAAQELRDGFYVNLGIGIPTLVANNIPQGMARKPARISDAEQQLLQLLWDESPLGAVELAARAPADRDWSLTTVKTMPIIDQPEKIDPAISGD